MYLSGVDIAQLPHPTIRIFFSCQLRIPMWPAFVRVEEGRNLLNRFVSDTTQDLSIIKNGAD